MAQFSMLWQIITSHWSPSIISYDLGVIFLISKLDLSPVQYIFKLKTVIQYTHISTFVTQIFRYRLRVLNSVRTHGLRRGHSRTSSRFSVYRVSHALRDLSITGTQ